MNATGTELCVSYSCVRPQGWRLDRVAIDELASTWASWKALCELEQFEYCTLHRFPLSDFDKKQKCLVINIFDLCGTMIFMNDTLTCHFPD